MLSVSVWTRLDESAVFTGTAEHFSHWKGKVMAGLLLNVQRFMRDQEGATAIEYALLASLIAVVIAVTVGTVGAAVEGLFVRVESVLPTP